MQRAGARGPVGGLLLIAAAVLWSPVALTGDADPALRTNPARDDLNLEFSRREIIKVDVEMALINVTVTDPIGRMVTGLDKEHFVLKEDSKPQVIEQFGAEEAPLSLAVVFDASGSMGYKMTKSREAVAQFFKTVNPEDEFFLVQFNNRPEMVTGFTRSLEEIQNRLTFVRSKGRTALLDAIYLALSQMKEAKNSQKALLVISDGGDNSSRYTPREIKRTVRESDVQIYAIGIYEPYASRGRTPEEAAGPGLLTEIAESTGGRQFAVQNVNELPDIAEKIGIELRNQYVLGYIPENTQKDGKWRRVKVEIKKIRGMPELRPYYRNGYYAPTR
ncbi:MAG: VWA domain-containing protein [Bryobacterales bacterium]|nr:VWA domain-containing protein [Bryobacterales bacterium]MDE0264679.1 VWA domain-containing protein [Bryobacterales bacterium]MDE0624291.1 VWA domain-containing protein [Bryobacterales bacterium]